jgi:hypothetical protein
MTQALGVALIAFGTLVLLIFGFRLRTRESVSGARPPPLPPEEEPILSVLEELERYGRAGLVEAQQHAKIRKWLRPIGILGRTTTYGALFWGLYIYWPKDIFHIPLAGLTLSDVFDTVFFVILALFFAKFFLSPSEDEEAKDAWGWLGVVIMIGGTLALLHSLGHFQTLAAHR